MSHDDDLDPDTRALKKVIDVLTAQGGISEGSRDGAFSSMPPEQYKGSAMASFVRWSW